MNLLLKAILFLCLAGSALAQTPEKPKLASTPTGQSYLGDNPATITDSPTYHRTKPLRHRRKNPVASATEPTSGSQ